MCLICKSIMIDIFERALKRAKLQRDVNDSLRQVVAHTKKENDELRKLLEKADKMLKRERQEKERYKELANQRLSNFSPGPLSTLSECVEHEGSCPRHLAKAPYNQTRDPTPPLDAEMRSFNISESKTSRKGKRRSPIEGKDKRVTFKPSKFYNPSYERGERPTKPRIFE